MPLSREDRDNVNAMHHIANGTGSGALEASRKRGPRDDSGHQSIWKQEPVIIEPPGSQRRPSSSGHPTKSLPRNPYSQITYSDLSEAPSRTNPNALALVRVPKHTRPHQINQRLTKTLRSDPPPAKKQKLETPSMTHKTPASGKSRRPTTWNSTGSTSRTSAPGGAYPITTGSHSRSTNGHVHPSKTIISLSHDHLQLPTPTTRSAVIDLDLEEDLGVPVSNSFARFMPQAPSTSSDDLQLIPSGNTVRSDSTPDSIGMILGVSKPSDQHAFGGFPPTHDIKPPPAGPHTCALKAQFTDRGHAINGTGNEMDPIEDPDEFDTIPRERALPEQNKTLSVPENVVKKQVLFFESQTRPREVDLTNIRRKKVNGMKTKALGSATKNAYAFDLGKSPSSTRRDQPPHSPATPSLTTYKTTSGRHRGNVFPLEAYAHQGRIVESVNSEETRAELWGRIQDTHVSVVRGPIETGNVVLDIKLEQDIRNAQLPHGGATVENFPLLIFTPSSSTSNTSLLAHIENIENQQSDIILKPLTSHETWSPVKFEKMCNDMRSKAKSKISFAYLDAAAFRSQWEALCNLQGTSPAEQPQSQVAKRRPQPRPTYAGAAEASFASTSPGVRRSKRQMTSDTQPSRSPSSPGDEIILLYPPTGTGAVNVTNGDLKRLEPGEFLNDTLIELGLKLWLYDLRCQRPEFADQVHVFSSFFYTQLNQKNLEEGYQSVRKWTSRFDLFQKKYIIVPINEHLHWYLAIICHPDRALQQPPPPQVVKPNVTTRIRAQQSLTTRTNSQGTIPSHEESVSSRASNSKVSATSMTITEDEQEVERVVHVCPTTPRTYIPTRPTSPSSSVSSMTVQPDNEYVGMEVVTASDSEGEHNTMSLDVSMEPQLSSPSVPASLPDILPIPSKRFYEHAELSGSNSHSGIQVASEIEEEEVDQLQDDDLMDVDITHSAAVEPVKPEQPYIFSFDSLGTRHPHALKVLSRYLEMEAKDKKGWAEIVQPVVKPATVPAQPNYCDCGVYMLHFVEQFMSDPDSFSQQILHQKLKKAVGSDKLDRERLWSHDKVAGKRQELRERIVSLSTEWRREKQVDGKGKGRDQTEDQPREDGTKSIDTDSDIEVVEMSPKPIKSPKPPRTTKAARLR